MAYAICQKVHHPVMLVYVDSLGVWMRQACTDTAKVLKLPSLLRLNLDAVPSTH